MQPKSLVRGPICPLVRLLAILLAVAAISPDLVRQAGAQEAAPPGYKAYKLEHAPAAEFGAQLRKVLAKAPGKPEVVVDKQSNRVLVQGLPEAHRLTAQLVKALDLPANAEPEAGPK